MSANTNPIYYANSTVRDGHLVSGLNTTHIPLADSAVKTVQSFNSQHSHSVIPFNIPLDVYGLAGVPTGRTIESVSLVGTLQGSGNGTGVKFEVYEVPLALLDPTWRDFDSDARDRWTTFSTTNNGAHIDDCALLDSELTVSTGQSNLTFDVSAHSLLDGVVIAGTIEVAFLVRVDHSVKNGWGNFYTQSDSALRWRLVVTYSGAAPAGPEPEIATSSPLSFGNIETNQTSAVQTITITNTGPGDLVISSVSLTGTNADQFTIDDDSGEATLGYNETRTVDIIFAPDSAVAEAKSANLTIASNDTDEPSVNVALSGTEIDPIPDIDVDPASINFGVIEENQSSATFEVTITNRGNGDLNFTSVGLIGADAGEWTITADSAEDPLATDEFRTVTLRFDPTSGGAKSASLEIVTDDPEDPTSLVTLVGIASDAPDPEKPLLMLGEGDHPEASLVKYDVDLDLLVAPAAGILLPDASILTSATGGGGVTTFTGLSDTPANYSGAASKAVAVNGGATALEFVDPATLFAVPETTDDITEGGSLFFTIERAQDAIAAFLAEGDGISLTHNDAGDTLTVAVAGLTTAEFADAGVEQWTNDAGYVTASHNHNASAITAGTLPIARGGTNGTSFTTDTMLKFNGTSVVSLANGTEGQILKVVGGVPAWASGSGILTVDWGDILGTLADQTDLQAELDAKQDVEATLTALAAYNTNGLLTQTAADTFTGRTITGTADKIDVSNGNGVSGNPTLTISGTYVGQTSITTLGTIATGTWNATEIGVAKGGTGTTTTFTAGSVVFAGASGVYSQDNTGLFWDNTNKRLGIRTTAPGHTIDARFPTAGTTTTIRSFHEDTTNGASHARLQALVGGVSGGDAYFYLGINGVTAWIGGLDNSDSDKFKIENSTSTLSSSYALGITTGNVVDVRTNLKVGTDLFVGSTTTAVVSGNVLDVAGAVSIGSGLAGATPAATNGLLVEGTIRSVNGLIAGNAIGVAAPSGKYWLQLHEGTAPSAAVNNSAIVYADDSSDATTTLALYLEQAVEAIGTFTASHKVKIKVNGTEYWIQLDAV